jgi:hypothetical protein
LHSPIAAVGRRRRKGKYTFQKKKIQRRIQWNMKKMDISP